MGRRVRLDQHMCEGHALCIDIDPDVFTLSDNDVASCIEEPADSAWPRIRAAVDACPRGAISIVDE
ncbi:ferredoxin [Mycobacterium sp. OTB74]|uniref:ferredoxin n=1 Tax=Mycobacterium sp. OTB74 TaxID=1853452 RepID=UPI002475AF14|nr:ferredoxin [Mycobacterium sp. OTB74]MDH6245042.1 ferredoxin [Mycobacterium sp. OTB74]